MKKVENPGLRDIELISKLISGGGDGG